MYSQNITHCIKRGVNHEVHQVQRKQTESEDIFKMSTIGTNTSTQACWLGYWSTASSISDCSSRSLATHAADAVAAHHERDSDVIFMSHVK